MKREEQASWQESRLAMDRRQLLRLGGLSVPALMAGCSHFHHNRRVPDPLASFQMNLDGQVNNKSFRLQGEGQVRSLGIYLADLSFSSIPAGLHPSALAIIVTSICCYLYGAPRNDGLNIKSMGATGYSTGRSLRLADAGAIDVEGDVAVRGTDVTFTGRITGEAQLPTDLSGLSMYLAKIDPVENGQRLNEVAKGTIFRKGAVGVPVDLNSFHNLTPRNLPNPLRGREYRIVTENGVLDGRVYRTNIVSILDGQNTLKALDEQQEGTS